MNANAPRRWWRAPALRALLVQCLAYPLTLATVWLLASNAFVPSWAGAALAQGAWAGLLSWLMSRRVPTASWWHAIAFVLPPAVLLARGAAAALALPPSLFLGVFLFMVLLYWSTFRTQVPYYPSGREAWDLVAAELPARPLSVVDIGSGLGGFVLELARRRPDCTVAGIELAPLPWLASWLRARISGSRARFLRGDYEALDFGQCDIVFAYLSPAAMAGLWRKAHAEMRPGSMLFSYEFLVPDRQPDRRFVTTNSGKVLYLWHF
jgi:SAM-dependent methyltransferase